jgi:5-methyltetrahydropteroyltriglutamate--homocysteine methyltransferase
MPIPTEPIGSIPRPQALISGLGAFRAGRMSAHELSAIYESAVADTIERFQATGSPVIIDGEQTKPSFATYPVDGLEQVAPHGVVGVTNPIDPRVETAEEVRDRVLEAAEFIVPDRLGTTDDCGFAPFADDVSTARETAFEKIRARVAGTALAARVLGL